MGSYRKWIGAGVLAAVLAIGSMGPADTAAAKDEVVNLRFTSHMSPTNRQVANVVKPWCKMVEDDSKGRIKFKVFPGGVLHGANDGFKAAGAANITDFTHAYPSYVPGNFHLNHGTGLPFLYPNAYVGSLVCEELYNKYLKKEYEGMGVYLMSYQVTANYQIVTKSKPVRTLEDLKGLKIRSAGGMANDFLAAVGAIPVALPAVEAYTALQTGLLDGVLTNAIDIISNRLHEITKYVTISDASTVPVATCMNKKTYNALPKDLRLLVYNSNRKYPQMMAKEYEEGVLDDVKKTGMTVINLSEQEKARWVAAAKKVEDKFIADNEAKGYPAKEFMKELHALTKKYEKWTPAQIWEQVTKNPVQGIND